MYRVEATRARIKRSLKRISQVERQRIGHAVAALQNEPRPSGAVQLQSDVYRIRVGNYRVIYKVYEDDKLILIGRVVRRSEHTYKGIGSLFD